jgi:hypothetical protein
MRGGKPVATQAHHCQPGLIHLKTRGGIQAPRSEKQFNQAFSDAL